MSESKLPANPSLEQLYKQAKELLRQARAGSPEALARFQAQSGEPVLAGAQFVIAREYGFESWAKLKHRQQHGNPRAECKFRHVFRVGPRAREDAAAPARVVRIHRANA